MTVRYAHPTQESMRNTVNKLSETFERSQNKKFNGQQNIELKRQIASLSVYN